MVGNADGGESIFLGILQNVLLGHFGILTASRQIGVDVQIVVKSEFHKRQSFLYVSLCYFFATNKTVPPMRKSFSTLENPAALSSFIWLATVKGVSK